VKTFDQEKAVFLQVGRGQEISRDTDSFRKVKLRHRSRFAGQNAVDLLNYERRVDHAQALVIRASVFVVFENVDLVIIVE
jgi:hypothetical protein